MWNHRIWKRTTLSGEVLYGVHETYYNKSGEICGATSEPTTVLSAFYTEFYPDEDHDKKGLKELKWQLEKMLNCLDTPILDMDNFKWANWDE